MEQLAGKRLLVLGGNPWMEVIQTFCKENEIVVVTAGNNPNSSLNRIADEYYCIDSTDAISMKNLIVEKKIDGVYMGGSEPVISVACEYINELRLPCYCNKQQWECLQNKRNFKELCIKNGLPVVSRYEVNNNSFCLTEDCFPVITKPADGSGSNGFSVCNNNDELKRGFIKASQDSPTGSVIVEKFVKNKGVVCFYTISEGRVFFSGISDKYPVRFQKQGSFVGGLFVYESPLEKEFRYLFEEKIQALVSSLGIKEGPLWIEVFYDEGQYFFNEVGFRYGGSVSVYATDYLFGINQVAADIYFALTGKSKLHGFTSMISPGIQKKKHYAVYPIYLAEGIVYRVTGVDSIRKRDNVIRVIEKLGPGDTVKNNGSFGQVFALVHFMFNTKKELNDTVNDIHNSIEIISDQGNSIVMRMLNLEDILVLD